MLELAGRVSGGVDVGYLLELQRPLKSGGVIVAPAQEDEVLRGVKLLSTLSDGVAVLQDQTYLVGDFLQVGDAGTMCLLVDCPVHVCQVQCQQVQQRQLGCVCLGAGHTDFRTGVHVEHRVGLSRDRAARNVAQREHLHELRLRLSDAGKGVGRLTALRDADDQSVATQQWVAIAKLAGDVNLRVHAGKGFEVALAHQAGVPTGAAGLHVNPVDPGECLVVQLKVLETDVSVRTGVAFEQFIQDVGLLVYLLEHVVVEAVLVNGGDLHV